MIGISKSAEVAQRSWEERDRQAWKAAAERLQADGWTQNGSDGGIRTYFSKPGQPTQVLTRQLGYLNWTPRPEWK
jgi:hypothetical protein